MPRQPLFIAPSTDAAPAGGTVSWRARLQAAVFAGRFDDTLAFGGTAAAGTALGMHAARLTSHRERRCVAGALRRVVRQAHEGRPFPTSTVAVHRANVVAAEEAIDAITLRLHSPRQVSAMGMARLRRLLGDGAGPLYAGGRGDLDGRLRAVLAVL